jgi:hypothetical protein
MAGVVVERRPDGEQWGVDERAHAVDELLLPRAAQADQHDPGSAGADARGDLGGLTRLRRSELRRLRPGDRELRELLAQRRGEPLQGRQRRAVQVNGKVLPRRAGQHPQGERRAVDPVGQFRAVQRVERPAHRLPVGDHEIERVEPGAVGPVLHTGHHPVHRERGEREWLALARGGEDLPGRRVVVDGVDQHAEDARLSLVDHGSHLSTLAS